MSDEFKLVTRDFFYEKKIRYARGNMIKFGTSGWRGVIAQDFTFKNLKLAVLGIADYLTVKKAKKGVIVGYDTRFMSERFAHEVVLVLASRGIKSYLADRDTPTPVISAYIIKNKLDGGINITASHNPFQYSGLKFSPSWGGSALPEDTIAIEEFILKNDKNYEPLYHSMDEVKRECLCEVIDPKKDYYEMLMSNIDLKPASKNGIKVFYDPIFGTGRGYLDEICKKAGIEITALNNFRDPYFGNMSPEPSSENLFNLKAMIQKEKGLSIGVSTDGDADRFGIIGSDGSFIEPNKIIALLGDYLARERQYPKGIGFARSFATGSLIDLVAKKHSLKLYENPVGFKYIGKLISENKIILGGEESAGLSIMNHVPEKDGILACLLIVEMMGRYKSGTEELLNDLYKRVGRLETKRENFRVGTEVKEALPKKINELRDKFEGEKIEKIEKMDGTKIYFKDNSWLLFRESGTEPVVRLYGEAQNEGGLDSLMKKGEQFLFAK